MDEYMKWIYHYNAFKKKLYQKFPLPMNILSLALILFWVFVIKWSILDANNIPSPSMVPTLKVGDFLFVNKMRYTLRIPFTQVNLLRFGYPQRGDIVTFIPPETAGIGKTFVKRIVGMPGDRLKVLDNEIFINGEKYPVELIEDERFEEILGDIDFSKDESKTEVLRLFKEEVSLPNEDRQVEHYMLKTNNSLFAHFQTNDQEWEVPANQYFMVGDNRDNSDDSRRWGFVDLKRIEGKVFLIYFSVNWMQSDNPGAALKNPFVNLLEGIMGKNKDAKVRWSRIGSRIY